MSVSFSGYLRTGGYARTSDAGSGIQHSSGAASSCSGDRCSKHTRARTQRLLLHRCCPRQTSIAMAGTAGTRDEHGAVLDLRMQCLSQNGLTAYRRFYLQFSLIDMVVSAKNSSSSTPVRSRVNVSPVRISAPATCSQTSREAMRCGTCSAQRTAQQRTAHSATASLTAACRADTPRVDHKRTKPWLPTGCTDEPWRVYPKNDRRYR